MSFFHFSDNNINMMKPNIQIWRIIFLLSQGARKIMSLSLNIYKDFGLRNIQTHPRLVNLILIVQDISSHQPPMS